MTLPGNETSEARLRNAERTAERGARNKARREGLPPREPGVYELRGDRWVSLASARQRLTPRIRPRPEPARTGRAPR